MSLLDIGCIYCKVAQRKVCIKPKEYPNIQTIGDCIVKIKEADSYMCSYSECPYSKILSKTNCETISNYLNGFFE